MRLVLVAIGGAIGAVARFGLNDFVSRALPHPFPFGTFLVNMLGCAVFGILAGVGELRTPFSPEARAFLFVGILGGFTTFSSFGYETLLLMREGHVGLAALNASGQVVVGVAAVWLGWTLVRLVS